MIDPLEILLIETIRKENWSFLHGQISMTKKKKKKKWNNWKGNEKISVAISMKILNVRRRLALYGQINIANRE